MDIIKGNKLIAEFMGYVKVSQDKDFTFYKHPDGNGITIQSDYDYKKYINHQLMELKGFIFHRNWDWLMKVVDKIEAIKYNEKYVVVNIALTGCYIYCKGNKSLSINLFNDSKIDAVWNACAEFVDWYNKNCNKS